MHTHTRARAHAPVHTHTFETDRQSCSTSCMNKGTFEMTTWEAGEVHLTPSTLSCTMSGAVLMLANK